MLVNNAGGAFGADPVAEADLDDWQRMYDVNVLGTVRVTKALLPALVERPAPATSCSSARPPGTSSTRAARGYTAAKHARARAGRDAAAGADGQPVRVIEIAPGMVRTEEFSLIRFGGDAERGRRRSTAGCASR